MKSILKYLLIVILFTSICFAGIPSTKDTINNAGLASYFRDFIGFPYDSHGCLHFTPSDIYLLYKTIPVGTELIIKPYSAKDTGFADNSISYFDDYIINEADMNKYASIFRDGNISLVVYPALSRLYIFMDDKPYMKMYAHSGPPYAYFMLEDVEKNKPLNRDFMMATPTDPGTYRILTKTDHYFSPTYSGITQIAFGEVLNKVNGIWYYNKNNKLTPAPQFMQNDLEQDADNRYYNYYDSAKDRSGNIVSVRWAGNDFGKYVITWTKDGRNKYPEIGYCAGQLLFEQYSLVSQLADILTMPGTEDLDKLIEKSSAFKEYKKSYDFVSTAGKQGNLSPEEEALFRLYHKIPLTLRDKKVLDPRLKKAFDSYNSGIPVRSMNRKDVLSLYNYLRIYNIVIEKEAKWYQKLSSDWGFWSNLRKELISEFDKDKTPQEARKKIVERRINDRLEFKTIK